LIRQARLQALAATLLFSTGGAAIKVEAFTGMQVSAIRAGIAVLALLALTRARIRLSWVLVATGLLYAISLTLFVNATKLTTAANAIFLQSTAPFYIVLAAPWVLREQIRRRDAGFLAVMGAGLVLCFFAEPAASLTAPDPAAGNILAVLCSITWAGTLMALRGIERSDEGAAMSAVILGNAFACAIALPLALPLPSADASAWATLVYLGVVQIGVAYVFLTRAIRHLPALEISLLLLLEPVLNPIWTWIVRGEEPGALVIAGGALIVAGTALKTVLDSR
jgi:DME family drug/metabolite transporter